MKYGNYRIDENDNSSVSFIIKAIQENSKVIELGSSYGYILKYLKDHKNCSVHGYEIDNKAVDLANEQGIITECIDLDKIQEDFFETLNTDIDFIICADVLEHLKNMSTIIKWISHYLKKNPKCKLLISFPNITYYGVINQLLQGTFKYSELGILDNTHLRFFDKFELEKIFNENNLEITTFNTVKIDPHISEFNVSLNKSIVEILEQRGHEDYLTYQYVFELQYSNKPTKIINTNTNKKSIIKEWNSKKDSQIIELTEIVNKKDSQIIELNELAWGLQDQVANLKREEIDISIVTYNSKKWVDNFFESLINQQYPLDKLHIYITDNSSTDDTYNYLKSFEEKYTNIFGSYALKQEKNLGFGFGHNNNFKRSRSKFILATNIDLQFEADAIIKLVDYATNDHDNTASWEMRQKPYEHPKYYNPVTLETTWSSSACVLFKKEAIDNVGHYDENIFMYGEDVELSYRLRDHGYKLKYYPKSVCWHYTYEEANQVKEVQYFGSTFANVLIRMRYGTKAEIIDGMKQYVKLLNVKGQFFNQRRKQLKQFIKLIFKAPFFLLNRKNNINIKYKFLHWDYEIIRDGAFYEYAPTKQPEYPLVSVITRSCCERNGFLREAVESIKNQTYSNIELVIIEDGGNNAQEIIDTIESENITNLIYEPIEKSGRCHAGNVGLSKTNGEYIIFLDDDDLFFADHIEVLVQGMIDNPDIGACYTSSFEVPTEIISKEPFKYDEKSFSVYHREEFSRETMLHHNFIPIQSILFKRSLYEEYGGFDEDLDNLEDWNLWTRYSYLNDFKFIDKTTSLYRVPSCPEISSTRQDELDRYYQIAVKKAKTFIKMINSEHKSVE